MDASLTTVFLGNLSYSITSESLHAVLAPLCPGLVEVDVIVRKNRNLGYGFCRFSSLAEAESAVLLLHGKELDGRPLNAEISKHHDDPAGSPLKSFCLFLCLI